MVTALTKVSSSGPESSWSRASGLIAKRSMSPTTSALAIARPSKSSEVVLQVI